MMHSLPRLLLLCLLAGSTATSGAAQAVVDGFPTRGQLFPRDQGNTATVPVGGQVTAAGWSQVVLELYGDGQLVDLDSEPLVYSGGSAPFAVEVTLAAGLVDYRMELWLESPTGRIGLATAENLACGDVFLVQGQSNAVARDYWNENRANLLQSPWVRSFGTASTSGQAVLNDRTWYFAEGEESNDSGTVGSWPLQLGALVVQHVQMPVAILNGAVGGTPIVYHLRNDADPYDTSTNYGRLLWRAEEAGLRQHARAIFWYQGESDGANAGPYGQRFDDLIGDWRADYPALERVYFMQVRQGCGAAALSDIFEVQRQIALRHPDLQLMSTTAMPDHDGCHYFTNGYRKLAFDLARLAARDFYGWSFGPEVEPPNAIAAWRSNPAGDELTISFGPPGVQLQVDPGAENDFRLEDQVSVTTVTVLSDRLVLQLAQPTTSTTLRYVGRSGGTSGWITNQRGVGALTFNLPLP